MNRASSKKVTFDFKVHLSEYLVVKNTFFNVEEADRSPAETMCSTRSVPHCWGSLVKKTTSDQDVCARSSTQRLPWPHSLDGYDSDCDQCCATDADSEDVCARSSTLRLPWPHSLNGYDSDCDLCCATDADSEDGIESDNEDLGQPSIAYTTTSSEWGFPMRRQRTHEAKDCSDKSCESSMALQLAEMLDSETANRQVSSPPQSTRATCQNTNSVVASSLTATALLVCWHLPATPSMSSAGLWQVADEDPAVVKDVRGCVWNLSKEAEGCRRVQEALQAATQKTRIALAQELKGHAVDAMKDPYANFVMQKIIALVPVVNLQFIVEELSPSSIRQVARNKFGCRIMQRLVDTFQPAHVNRLVEVVVNDFMEIACHPYGNYVIQHFLSHVSESYKAQLRQAMEANIRELCMDTYGCTVLSAALTKGRPREQTNLARSMFRDMDAFVFLSCSKLGHVAAVQALRTLRGDERVKARANLLQNEGVLKVSRFGKTVLARIGAEGGA